MGIFFGELIKLLYLCSRIINSKAALLVQWIEQLSPKE